MTDLGWIALAGMAVTLLLAALGGVVWLVRLEGKTVANTVAVAKAEASALAAAATNAATIAATDKRLDTHITAQDKAREEIIRLQEQIKHLTDLIERWLSPAPVRARRAAPVE